MLGSRKIWYHMAQEEKRTSTAEVTMAFGTMGNEAAVAFIHLVGLSILVVFPMTSVAAWGNKYILLVTSTLAIGSTTGLKARVNTHIVTGVTRKVNGTGTSSGPEQCV